MDNGDIKKKGGTIQNSAQIRPEAIGRWKLKLRNKTSLMKKDERKRRTRS